VDVVVEIPGWGRREHLEIARVFANVVVESSGGDDPGCGERGRIPVAANAALANHPSTHPPTMKALVAAKLSTCSFPALNLRALTVLLIIVVAV
jgi:hypothetical protein